MKRKTSYNNCLVWALWQWWTKDGYLLVRRADVPGRWYPHFAYMPFNSRKIYHFVPVNKVNFPWPIFKGYVKINDHKKFHQLLAENKQLKRKRKS